MNKMMEVSIPGRGTKKIPKADKYGVMFRRVFRAFYPELPCPKTLKLRFYPARLVDEAGETFFQHSSLGWTTDNSFRLVRKAAKQKKENV